ncbi:MAG: hypothetical protein MO846_08945 [Candidatus Devosia symbiotica]|nr:hypothetical protein [Candidatus Devosia symbiotica]
MIEAAEENAFERGDHDMFNRVQAHEWLDGSWAQSGRVSGVVLFLEMNALALSKPDLSRDEHRPRAWHRMAKIAVLSLLLIGDQDFTVLINRHEYLSEEMPNAFAAMLENVDHIPT